jgi:uncharacterized protein YbjT (DUF2867 family)
MTTELKVLVTGATGNQGGAVTNSLLSAGHNVRALVRNADSPAARKLADRGVELVRGDLDDANSLATAMRNVDSVYMMGNPMPAGVEGEIKQGIAFADAAKSADVGHLVYGSVANADQNTGIPHFDSKYEIEQHIKTLGIPYTISAPVYFMDNVTAPWSHDALMAGKIVQAMPGDRRLQQVSVKNIGDFVASLMNRRETVFGERFDIAGDELTGEECAAILSHASGCNIRYQSIPVSVVRDQSEVLALMFEWLDRVGYSANPAELHKIFSDVEWQDYTQWANSQDWRVLR